MPVTARPGFHGLMNSVRWLCTGAFCLFAAAGSLAAGCGGGGGGGSGGACARLSDQCARCRNAIAQDQCFRATDLGLESTCQQLLDSGTYEPTGVECASPN